MATHQDVLDAIARVRASTSDRDSWSAGLGGADIATITNPLSTSAALGAVLTKIIAAHPDSFSDGSPGIPAEASAQGAAAEAIRDAQAALAQQKSTAAQVDLRVITAVLGAQSAHGAGVAALDRLAQEIEEAVRARPDLDTPAGARAFQHYLISKIRDIAAVVQSAGLDSESKAALAGALSDLYASAAPDPLPNGEHRPSDTTSTQPPAPVKTDIRLPPPNEPAPRDEDAPSRDTAFTPIDSAADLTDPYPGDYLPAPPAGPGAAAPPATPVSVPTVPMPAWGGGLPSGSPVGAGTAPLPALPGTSPLDPIRHKPRIAAQPVPEPAAEDPPPMDPTTVVLPGGETVTAPSPEIAAAITAAVAGTPIPDAFGQQDIAIPAPGTPVAEPLDPDLLLPGDIGLFADRYALAVGSGKALVDGQIEPITSVTGSGFLGWQHPPEPDHNTPTPAPEAPAPTRPTETAPS